jgi:ABC-type branched-subunit amino acid transport system ATPase component/predicted MFS family arabinose efflux permease
MTMTPLRPETADAPPPLEDSTREDWKQRLTGGESLRPLALLTALQFTDTVDVAAFLLLIPEIRDYYGASITKIEVVVTIATLLPLIAAVPIGFLSDRIRRTPILGIGFVLSGIFSTGTAFSTGLLMLGIMRLGAGLGLCFQGGSQSFLSDTYPLNRRTGIFSVLSIATPAASFVGPIMAGVVGTRYGWQLPFLFAGLPTLVLAPFVFWLRNPARGVQERLAQGASPEVAAVEDAPPGWTEGWRVAKSIRTLRRLWASLPFLVGSVVVVYTLVPNLLHDQFQINTLDRGYITAIQQAAAAVTLIFGTPLLIRIATKSPARMITFAGLLSTLAAGAIVLTAFAPWLPLTIAGLVLIGLTTAPLAPAILALISLTVPPRARGFALSFGSFFVALGIGFAIPAGGFADAFGFPVGIAVMAPVFLVGAIILTSAGASVNADIRAASAAAMAGETVRQSRAEGKTKLLVCRDVDAGYGQVQILFGVDLEIEEGEIVALLGTNGAGKSTLLAAINGSNPAWNGAVLFDGEAITQLPASEHVNRGIVSVPGGKAVFPGLTVTENLDLALWAAGDAGSEERLDRVYEFFPRLKERRGELAGNLSGGEQQMLALSQAFIARPRLLMIDELSLGLAPVVVEQLLDILRAIHADGATIVLVEQSVNVALTVAKRAVFMEKGEVRFSGPTDELMHRPDVLRSVFLAGAASSTGSYARGRRAHALAAPLGEPEIVLRVTDVHRSYGGVQALAGATLEVRAGETIGLIGPNGAGKTTLFDVISGFVPPTDGTVELLGQDITDASPERRALLGLGRSFQDARLFPALTVEETLLVTLDRHHQARNIAANTFGLPKARKAESTLHRRAERLMTLMGITDFRDKFVRELSTGTRRLVDLACVLAGDPDVLLLDEPSSGIAQKETEEMPALLDRIKYETGCALLIIEHDMQLISAISDELVAMELGQVVVRGKPADVLNDPRVVAAYLGNSTAAIQRSGHQTAPGSGVTK